MGESPNSFLFFLLFNLFFSSHSTVLSWHPLTFLTQNYSLFPCRPAVVFISDLSFYHLSFLFQNKRERGRFWDQRLTAWDEPDSSGLQRRRTWLGGVNSERAWARWQSGRWTPALRLRSTAERRGRGWALWRREGGGRGAPGLGISATVMMNP